MSVEASTISGRVVVYAMTRAAGRVDAYVVGALAALRPHADHVMVVSAGDPIDEASRRLLDAHADSVIDAHGDWSTTSAYRAAMEVVGASGRDVSQILLSTDGWFGPFGDFGETFDRMAAGGADFWSMTDHGAVIDGSGEVVIPRYFQWHWLWVGERVINSPSWRQYWADADSRSDSDDDAERRLSAVLVDAGFRGAAAFLAEESPTSDPSFLNAQLLIEQGCPVLRMRPLTAWPPYLAHEASVGAWVLQAAQDRGYPTEEILSHLARTVPPKVLNADVALMNVLSPTDTSYDPSRPPRVVVVAHIYYDDMTDELLDHADTLPVPYDLVITTPEDSRASSIRARVAARATQPLSVDVRVVESNYGRDQSALLISCRDVILADDHDLIVKIHSKKSVGDGVVNGELFKKQQLSNLLDSPGYTRALLALFQREEKLGLVFPPMIHIGMPTMGRGWASNKDAFAAVAAHLGIRVPLDDVSPLAPFGSMYVARPSALRRLAEEKWTWDQFALYGDGGLGHVLERIPAYAAGESGMYARTVSTREYMSVSHTALDFKLDQMAATTPGYLDEQITMLKRAGFWGKAKLADLALLTVRLHHPTWERNVARFVPTDATAIEHGRRKQRLSIWSRGRARS